MKCLGCGCVIRPVVSIFTSGRSCFSCRSKRSIASRARKIGEIRIVRTMRQKSAREVVCG